MKCPYCGGEVNAGKMLGSLRSDRKAKASKENGKGGGRPKKTKENLMPGPIANANAVNEILSKIIDQAIVDNLNPVPHMCSGGIHCPMSPVVEKNGKWFCEHHSK